jgi:predicted outer membrane repeat protein
LTLAGATNASLTLTGNSAPNGGGAFAVTMNNCALSGNSAETGGGAFGGTLNNCTVVGNAGTGAYGWYWGKSGELCTLNICIVYYNEPENYNTFSGLYSMRNCCTTAPAPDRPYGWLAGCGNITNEPVFVDLANGDFHLQAGSPCINAGTYLYASSDIDLDGQPRIVGGSVAIGAFEFQGVAQPSFHAWLERYGLPTDGSVDCVDSDGDGLNNWQGWLCGSNPTNALSVLRLLPPV